MIFCFLKMLHLQKNIAMINLVSDTVTKPSEAMLKAMFAAEVGDDVFKEDPTINQLEGKVAELFGKEAAIFCPSGTMTNQIAIKVHTRQMDEIICDELSHIFKAETGGYAWHSGVAVQLVAGKNGKITANQVAANIKGDFDWLPRTRMVVLENTANIGGGSFYTLPEIAPITELCKNKGLALHLDGARLYNALAETGETTEAVGRHFDSISLCLSKGLGAPVGSLLIGNQDFIKESRRVRKAMGGGMRQAGYLAAAGIFALDNNVTRLSTDHANARLLSDALHQCDYVENIRPVSTNIVIFDVTAPHTATSILQKLTEKGIKASAFGPQTVRFVTHLDVSEIDIKKVCTILKELV
jgi:threonine aldolase